MPDELLNLAWRAELTRRVPEARAELIEEYCDFEAHPGMRYQREQLRPVLAAVLPEHKRQVRAEAAQEIQAEAATLATRAQGMSNKRGKDARDLQVRAGYLMEAAVIARGESP
ncbi:hypothetical protein ACGFNU_21490 [Spirillospora sp. NPDC048911]|uniref:hypothetical protein n=1 Tax=Spirillospora sp. NPDC048911 TaxID=3364527 RepID=UPI0037215DAE